MSELKVYEDTEDFLGYDDTPAKMYDKYEADLLIAELKAENRKLEQEIERLKQENEMSLIGVNLHSPTSDGRLV